MIPRYLFNPVNQFIEFVVIIKQLASLLLLRNFTFKKSGCNVQNDNENQLTNQPQEADAFDACAVAAEEAE